jgi:hypothetical protein
MVVVSPNLDLLASPKGVARVNTSREIGVPKYLQHMKFRALNQIGIQLAN